MTRRQCLRQPGLTLSARCMADTARLSPPQPPPLSLPSPPPRKGSPGLRVIEAGSWWRVHRFSGSTGRFAPHAFNDTGLGSARFSPLRSVRADVIPTLYAAGTLESALMETVLHDVPFPSQGHIHDLDRGLQSDLHVSQIEIGESLQLVDLTKIGLQRMGLKVSELFKTDADAYPRTRDWAQWIHATVPQAHGLYWMSARQPEGAAMMLFGDRVASGVVRQGQTPPRHLGDPEVLSCLLSLLERLGCGAASNR